MPGAPNRPPENEPAAPPPPEDPGRRVLRRLVPSIVALRLPIWKGTPSRELVQPLRKAHDAYRARDFGTAEGALDQLAVRFAEPRWPTLPDPFKGLRVAVIAPQPPHWNPDHALTPTEREARQARRKVDWMATLAEAVVDSEARAGTAVDDLRPIIAEAKNALTATGAPAEFYERVHPVWERLLERLPLPTDLPARGPATEEPA